MIEDYVGRSAAVKRSTISAAGSTGVDRSDALAGVHRHGLNVAVGAREREVDRITTYALGDGLALAGALPRRWAPGGQPPLGGAVAKYAMRRGPTDVEDLGEHGVAAVGRQQTPLVVRHDSYASRLPRVRWSWRHSHSRAVHRVGAMSREPAPKSPSSTAWKAAGVAMLHSSVCQRAYFEMAML